MNPILVAILLGGYFLMLIIIAHFTGKSATTDSFFTANRKSPWFVVAFGMIGTTISGVTFISVPGALGIPFSLTVLISIFLIWVYTYRGGVKTIIWTDSLQTIFLLSAVILTIYYIFSSFGGSIGETIQKINDHPYSRIFEWDVKSDKYFFKQFIAGIFVTIVMVGLDQDMMQKNLTCKSLKESQKNMLTFSAIFVFVVAMFLMLGVLLYIFAEANGIKLPPKSDYLFPMLAMNHMSLV